MHCDSFVGQDGNGAIFRCFAYAHEGVGKATERVCFVGSGGELLEGEGSFMYACACSAIGDTDSFSG